MTRNTLFFLFHFIFLAVTFHAFSASLGDFRTRASGNWNQISTWEYYNGSAWVGATYTPSYTDGQIDVLAGYSVTVTAGLTIDETDVHGNVTVNGGVILTVNDGSGTDMSVLNTMTVNGTVVNRGTISGVASDLLFNSGSLYQHNKDGSTLPDATWNDGSTCEITGVTSALSITNTDQSFYNFKWNCPLQTSETNCAGNLQTVRGNFIMISTGSSGKLKLAETADYTLTISGNWDHQGGTLNMGGGSSYGYIHLAGNFSMTGGKITEFNSSGYITLISFSKAGEQSYLKTGGSFENNIDLEIISGATLDLGSYVVDGSLGQFTVNSGGTLKTSHTDGIAASGASGCIRTTSRYFSFAANYQYYRNGAQSSGNGFPSPLNGKLLIGSGSAATNLTLTNGSVTINGTLVLCSSTIANSTIVSGTVSYGTNGSLEYQGMSAQSTTIAEWPVISAPANVTINNNYGVSLGNDRMTGGTFTLTTGTFSIGPHTLTLNGTLVRTSGTLSGGSTSNITVGGTSPAALDLPDVSLGNLVLNRGSGLRLTGNVPIWGSVTMTSGAVTLLPSKAFQYYSGSRLKYNGPGDQTTHAEEFPAVSGPPSLQIDKPGGTTLNLAFSRILNEDLHLTSGNLSIGSNTLTLNALINQASGTLTGGGSSNIIFGGSAIAAILPSVTLNDLTINRLSGIDLGGNVTTGGTLNLLQGNLGIQANVLTINGYINQAGGNLAGTLSSSLIFGPAPSSTVLPPLYTGHMEVNRAAGIQMNGNAEVATSLVLTAGSLAISLHNLTLDGSLVLAGGGLTGGYSSGLIIAGSAPQMSLPFLWLDTLTISRPAGVSFSNDVIVENCLSLDNGPCNINGRLLTLNGSLLYNGGSLAGGATSSIFIGGSGSALTLEPVTLQSLSLNRAAGLYLAGDLEVLGLFRLMNGTLNRNGHLLYGPAATLRYQGAIQQTTTDEEFPETNGPFNIQVMNMAGVKLHADRIIPGDLLLDFGKFIIAERTLTLNGTITALSGTLQGGVTANLVFAPGASPGTLPAVTLNNLAIDRIQGVTTTGDCSVKGTLSLLNGDFMVGMNRTLTFSGFPISGNAGNLRTNALSGLQYLGSNPGFVVPDGVMELGSLTVSNPSGVSLLSGITIYTNVMITGYLLLNDHTLEGPAGLSLNPGAKLGIGHPDGVAGNIQLAGPVLLDSGADFEFNGTSDQMTNFLPVSSPGTIRNFIISNREPFNVTLNDDLTVTGELDILPGAKLTVNLLQTLTVENGLILH